MILTNSQISVKLILADSQISLKLILVSSIYDRHLGLKMGYFLV